MTKWNLEDAIAVAREESREEGWESGLEEGLEKGIAKGLEQGRVSERLEFARKMKVRAYPLAEIAEFTGLDIETINNL